MILHWRRLSDESVGLPDHEPGEDHYSDGASENGPATVSLFMFL
jgi:hypothetical protein